MIKRRSKGSHMELMAARRIEQREREPGFDNVLPAAGEAKRYNHLNRANRRKLESSKYRKAMKAKIAEAAKAVEPMQAAA
ncbi:hypothetical protein CPT_Palo_009 [Rhizobium phage Palo]|uniref:Uncharacterized protein n=1 Tax=Rhizobium phage Palo TaxID=2767573 RepID=A0A7L8G6W3_9CAUD|nr:hypothetical protein CPT_Palo_009 [Rhizobium phage Palo]